MSELENKITQILKGYNYLVSSISPGLLNVMMNPKDKMGDVPGCLIELKANEIIIYARVDVGLANGVIPILRLRMHTGELPKIPLTLTERPANRNES